MYSAYIFDFTLYENCASHSKNVITSWLGGTAGRNRHIDLLVLIKEFRVSSQSDVERMSERGALPGQFTGLSDIRLDQVIAGLGWNVQLHTPVQGSDHILNHKLILHKVILPTDCRLGTYLCYIFII